MFSRIARKVLNRIQPITRRHPDCNPISDLFPWIISDNYDTCFQAHDIASLFTPSSNNTSTFCLLVVFNSEGFEIFRKLISLQSLIKSPIQFSFLLRSYSFQYGTFAILHNTNPDCLSGTPSVLTDRGYLSFNSKSSQFRRYVHGNFDAVTLNYSGSIVPLGGISILPRSYYFQYLFDSDYSYDLFFVNPTSTFQNIDIYQSSKENIYDTHLLDSFSLQSRGSFIYHYRPIHKSSYLVFRSKIVLCRPLCFKRLGSTFDVFHA